MLSYKCNLKRLNRTDLVAVCSWCLKIRNSSGQWIDPGAVFFRFFGGMFTHSICEQCRKLYFPEFSRNISESQEQIDSDAPIPLKAPLAVSRGD